MIDLIDYVSLPLIKRPPPIRNRGRVHIRNVDISFSYAETIRERIFCEYAKLISRKIIRDWYYIFSILPLGVYLLSQAINNVGD